MGDEEDELAVADRARLHINLGKWGGEIYTVRFQGALSDFFGWFGLEDAAQVISEVQKGRATLGDVAEKIAQAPVNRLASSITPFIKTPAELAAKKTTYPNFFEPRSIRDRGHHIAKMWSVGHEYDFFAGNPSRGYARSWVNSVFYSVDTEEMAYNRVQELK